MNRVARFSSNVALAVVEKGGHSRQPVVRFAVCFSTQAESVRTTEASRAPPVLHQKTSSHSSRLRKLREGSVRTPEEDFEQGPRAKLQLNETLTKEKLVPKPVEGKPKIAVIGVGGGGGNAVNNMIAAQLRGVEFIVANTDAQSIANSLAEHKIRLGSEKRRGLGAGALPELGRVAAEECRDIIIDKIKDCHMVFITAGLGGGTGTGASPMIAQIARELGILTVAVVSLPFRFEGNRRQVVANHGLKELESMVDTIIVVPNQNLLAVASENTSLLESFHRVDAVLYEGVKGVTSLIVNPGLINLDFADIRTIMSGAGRAIMGTGEGQGPERARQAAEDALTNPLLGETSLASAKGLLVTICGGPDLTLFEVDEIMERIRKGIPEDAKIIFGSTYDESMQGRVRVSIIVTGIQQDVRKSASIAHAQKVFTGNVSNIGTSLHNST